ncbi:MAG: hypothetical protein LAC66_00525 [Methylotenera sp.]|nr:hypothetical protein [Methylotenera sp.]
MTREDVLRELELLPVWHLRTALPQAVAPVPDLEPVAVPAEATIEILPEIPPETRTETPLVSSPEAVTAVPEIAIPSVWTQLSSEDGLWLFVVAQASLTAEEKQLLQNMCQAMRIVATPPQAMDDALINVQGSLAKMVVVFGEQAAQALLASTESLSTLRAQVHSCHGKSLVATHGLGHLLAQPLDKAQTWHDLRLAMQGLADLQAG